MLAAANFTSSESNFAFELPRRERVQVFPGSSVIADGSCLVYRIHLDPREAVLLSDPLCVSVEGDVRFDSHRTGLAHATSAGSGDALVELDGGKTVRLARGKIAEI